MRRRLPGLVVVLATLVLLLAGLAVWVARQALDTGVWVDTSSALVRDPDVQQATAAYVADQLVDQDAATARLREILPDRADRLAVVGAGAIGELAERTTARALRSGAFQDLWQDANRLAHEQLVDLVEGDENVAVVLDLRPMLGRVASRIGLGADVVERLPEDRGRLTIIQGDKLETVRRAGRALRALATGLVLLALVLQVAAVLLARGSRRRAILRCGLGILLAGLALATLRAVAGGGLVEALTGGGAGAPAAAATWDIATGLLREIAAGLVALGVVVVACAWLAGGGPAASRVRGWIAPGLREQPGVVYGCVVICVLALLAAGLLPGGGRVVLVAVYVVFAVAGVAALRRQVEAERTLTRAG